MKSETLLTLKNQLNIRGNSPAWQDSRFGTWQPRFESSLPHFLIMNKKDLLIKLHAYVASDGMIGFWKCKEIRGNNIRVRNKLRVKFSNKENLLMNDFISSVKIVYPHLKYLWYDGKKCDIEVRSAIFSKDLLKLGDISTKNWEFPSDLTRNQKIIWIRTFADCDGTVNNYNYTRYVAIDSINLKGLKQLVKALSNLSIFSRIIKVKYKGNISYRLKISKYDNLIRYKNLIGFNHPKKKKKLDEAVKSYKRIF